MKNGLYSIHVTLQDGRVGKGSGVILFRDGQILGGDAYLFYTGSYTVKGDTFKGEVLVQRHTSPSHSDNPLFGGPTPVGIGVSGTFTDTAATMNGTALVGKASQIFGATLRKLADVISPSAVMPRFMRASSTPRLLGSSIHVSGILDRSSRATTCGVRPTTPPPAPAARRAAKLSGSACRRPAPNSRSRRPPSRVVTMV